MEKTHLSSLCRLSHSHLCLDVEVADAAGVEVGDGVDQLGKVGCNQLAAQADLRLHQVEHFAVLAQLKHQVRHVL